MKRSKFDLSHERKLSLQMGDLVPIMCQEVLPGDKFRVNTELLGRLAPMLAPVMHRMNVVVHNWFVPNRLVWDEWQDFITGGRDGDLAPVHPHFFAVPASNTALFTNGTLADYFGLPTIPTTVPPITNQFKVSALPFRAYQLIYNEFYRDPNLSQPVDFGTGSGQVAPTDPEFVAMMTLRKSSWEKDYFTSALPWAQRGGNAAAPVDYLSGTTAQVRQTGTELPPADGNIKSTAGGLKSFADENIRIESAAGVDINEWRKAWMVQKWLEKNARGGYRYIEMILKHFGVMSSDSRLQRPEFLGGKASPVVISEVLSTFQFSGDASGQPQGNMAGHGIAASSGLGWSRKFEEHGYVISILRVLPRTCYQQGIPKQFMRFDKFDYPWPTFANLGEQEVKQSEIYADYGLPQDTPDATFGYQERYAECKYGFNTVHGDFRDSLAYWHEGRIFASAPALNEAFVEADPSHRIFAVEDETVHKLYFQVYHKVDALRPLPFFGTPL